MVAGMDILVRIFLNIVQPNHFPSDLIGDYLRDAEQGLVKEGTIMATLKYELGFLVCLTISLLYIVLMPLIGICLARQNTSRPGRLASLYWGSYLVVMAVILVGNIYLYISNAAIKMHVDHSATEISSALDNLHKYTGKLLGNIEQGLYGSVDLLKDKLNATGQELGGQITDTLLAGLRLNEIGGHAESMSNFNMTPQLNSFKSYIDNDILSEDRQKEGTALHTALNTFQDQVTQAGIGPTLLRELQDNNKTLNDIPVNISNVVTKGVNMTEIETQISDVAKKSLGSVSVAVERTFNELKGTTATFTPTVNKVGYIIWAVGVALCCVLVLVLVRNVLGLLVGSVGVGPVFSFLLCSLLMLVVVPLFLLGGHCYTLVCKPWGNGQLFKFIDTQVDLGAALGLNISGLNLNSVYNDCANKRSLWDTLHLEKLVDLKRMLSMPRLNFTDAFGNMSFTFMNDSDKDKIRNLTVNVDEITTNLTIFANKLKEEKETVSTAHQNLIKNLIDTTNELLSQVLAFNGTVTALLSDVDNARDFDANLTIAGIVEDYFDKFTNELSDRFKSQIKQVNCADVAKEVDNARSFICENMVMSLNTFWFSLGMCLYFFIPGIVLSIRLAKYYRVEEIIPIVPDTGMSAASLERDQLKSLRKKAIDQFKAMNKYSNMPYVETDYYD